MTLPIPGLRGIDHIGLTVPDMDSAIDFFESLMGAEVLFRVGPLDASDNWMAVNMGVEANAVIRSLAMVRIAMGPTLELFEYEVANQVVQPPANSDIGGHHLAFYVDDIDQAVKSVREYGCLVLGEPKHITDGPAAGLYWVYFMSPWGLELELVSYPAGLAAYAHRRPAVWSPGSELGEPDPDTLP